MSVERVVGSSRGDRGSALVDMGVAVVVLALAVGFLRLGLLKTREKAAQTRCTNNLKQLGLSAIQYADDKRFFPHIRGLTELDGDATTSDGPRAIRLLTFFNYLDNPEVYVCPSSPDAIAPTSDKAKTDPRYWSWASTGSRGPDETTVTASPIKTAGSGDQPLNKLTSLSYGWTRRGFTSNSVSSNLLAADRARCHHKGSCIAVALDGHTKRLLFDAGDEGWAWLTSTAPDGGCLGLLSDCPHTPACDLLTASEQRERADRVFLGSAAGVVLVVLCSLALIEIARVRRRALCPAAETGPAP